VEGDIVTFEVKLATLRKEVPESHEATTEPERALLAPTRVDQPAPGTYIICKKSWCGVASFQPGNRKEVLQVDLSNDGRTWRGRCQEGWMNLRPVHSHAPDRRWNAMSLEDFWSAPERQVARAGRSPRPGFRCARVGIDFGGVLSPVHNDPREVVPGAIAAVRALVRDFGQENVFIVSKVGDRKFRVQNDALDEWDFLRQIQAIQAMDAFLPEHCQGRRTVHATNDPRKFIVDNGIGGRNEGLAYRRSPNLDDKFRVGVRADWGSEVEGELRNGWLKTFIYPQQRLADCGYFEIGNVYYVPTRELKRFVVEDLGITHFIDDRLDVLKTLDCCMRRYLFPTWNSLTRTPDVSYSLQRHRQKPFEDFIMEGMPANIVPEHWRAATVVRNKHGEEFNGTDEEFPLIISKPVVRDDVLPAGVVNCRNCWDDVLTDLGIQ